MDGTGNRIHWKTGCVVVLVVCVAGISLCVLDIRVRLKHGPGADSDWDIQHQQYLDRLEPPEQSADEVVSLLAKQKIINSPQLRDAAAWYMKEGNETVITQVIHNLPYQMSVRLPEEGRVGSGSVHTDYHMGPYPVMLWETEPIVRAYRSVLLETAARPDEDPRVLYILMVNMPENGKEKPYFEQVFHDDILLYLRVFSRFPAWPTLRAAARLRIEKYPCGWRDWSTLQEVFSVADTTGAEDAYTLFMQRYQANYHKVTGYFTDCVMGTRYEQETVWRGWSSEHVNCETTVMGVDNDDAVIRITGVKRVHFVTRDDVDITSLCSVGNARTVLIPLGRKDTQTIRYSIAVFPDWWRSSYQVLP